VAEAARRWQVIDLGLRLAHSDADPAVLPPGRRAGRLLTALRALPGVLTPGQVSELADRARARLRPAA